MGKFARWLFKVLAWLLLVAFSALVLMDMWTWFVVPLGVPTIGMAHVLGLRLCVSLFTNRYHKDTRTAAEILIYGFVLYSIMWCFGWVIAELM
jgi:hypothetical protein